MSNEACSFPRDLDHACPLYLIEDIILQWGVPAELRLLAVADRLRALHNSLRCIHKPDKAVFIAKNSAPVIP